MLFLVILFAYVATLSRSNTHSPSTLLPFHPSQQAIVKLCEDCGSEYDTRVDLSDIPFVTISYAQTLDGSIAPLTRTRIDISSLGSFQILHTLRGLNDAVLIGVNTLLRDKPQLNVRTGVVGIPTRVDPRPVILDSSLRLLHELGGDGDPSGHGDTTTAHDTAIAEQIRVKRPIIFTVRSSDDPVFKRAQAVLHTLGGEVATCAANEDGRCVLRDVLLRLRRDWGMSRVLIEGGARIIQVDDTNFSLILLAFWSHSTTQLFLLQCCVKC